VTAAQRLNGMVAGATQREQRSLVQNARIFASLLFLMDGMAFGTWAALIPSFQQKFQLLPAKLSVVLLGLIGGAMVSMPLAGKLIERWGSRRVASPAAVGFATALLLLAFAPSYATLILAAVVFGVWKGALDVSVNSQAITVEEAMGRPINSSFQGFWSLGSLCAASSLGLLMHRGFFDAQRLFAHDLDYRHGGAAAGARDLVIWTIVAGFGVEGGVGGGPNIEKIKHALAAGRACVFSAVQRRGHV
jgi:MFS family permease